MKCGYKVTGKKKLAIHTKQHILKLVCPCGYIGASRASVYSHQQAFSYEGHGGKTKLVHEVEHSQFKQLCAHEGLEAPPVFYELFTLVETWS